MKALRDSELESLCATSKVMRFARRGVVLSAGSEENKNDIEINQKTIVAK